MGSHTNLAGELVKTIVTRPVASDTADLGANATIPSSPCLNRQPRTKQQQRPIQSRRNAVRCGQEASPRSSDLHYSSLVRRSLAGIMRTSNQVALCADSTSVVWNSVRLLRRPHRHRGNESRPTAAPVRAAPRRFASLVPACVRASILGTTPCTNRSRA